MRHWLEVIAARRVRPRTYEGYRSKIERHVVPGLGQHRLERLQPEHIEEFYAALGAKGLAQASILQIHRIMSRALKVAMQRGKVAHNVATLVDAPSVRQEEVKPLTAAEARQLLDAADGLRNGARWSVALALGLRQGEALGLTWDAVDFEIGTVTVRQALQRVRGKGLVMVPPKSKAGHRVIAMPAELSDHLRAHRATQAEERLLAGTQWADHGLVFCQPNGKHIDPRRDWADWKALLAEAGVRDARLHDARHTAATLLLTQKVPARVVMQVLGHSQISLTLGTYSHVVPELATEAAERMGTALWGATETKTETMSTELRKP